MYHSCQSAGNITATPNSTLRPGLFVPTGLALTLATSKSNPALQNICTLRQTCPVNLVQSTLRLFISRRIGSKSIVMDEVITKIFLECARAIDASEFISRVSSKDKEFSFQNWFASRLEKLELNFDEPSRNTYPDFRLVNFPIGFEIKGLGFPGREANYDCNSQIPSGLHNGRTIYYVFGRYPAKTKDNQYPVYDLVMCHGDFLNADHSYIHKNKNLKGFGSYGDIMIRDRKMYVAPTPFALTEGTARQVTLIVPSQFQPDQRLKPSGTLTRVETARLIRGYHFDMIHHKLTPSFIDNPNVGNSHTFQVFRASNSSGPVVKLA
jgi:hypothetical protein